MLIRPSPILRNNQILNECLTFLLLFNCGSRVISVELWQKYIRLALILDCIGQMRHVICRVVGKGGCVFEYALNLQRRLVKLLDEVSSRQFVLVLLVGHVGAFDGHGCGRSFFMPFQIVFI